MAGRGDCTACAISEVSHAAVLSEVHALRRSGRTCWDRLDSGLVAILQPSALVGTARCDSGNGRGLIGYFALYRQIDCDWGNGNVVPHPGNSCSGPGFCRMGSGHTASFGRRTLLDDGDKHPGWVGVLVTFAHRWIYRELQK